MNLLKILTPENLEDEKQKFFTNTNYHPTFKYNWQEDRPKITAAGLKAKLIDAIFREDNVAIVDVAKEYFEVTSWEFDKLAIELTSTIPKKSGEESLENFSEEFNKAFQFLELNEYSLDIVDVHGFNFRPAAKQKKVLMSKYADFQFFSAKGEARHELVHIIRYENGKHNNIRKSSNYLPTEEGLATFMQDKAERGAASEFQHAAEYIASKIGLEGSLRDIYDYFISIGFNKDLAWQRAVRHKFGFTNTKEPGDILKPAMYFANSQRIKKLDSSKILKLFVGKIALSELSEYKEYSGIVKIEKLKEFYGF